jgi:hypothetical protein
MRKKLHSPFLIVTALVCIDVASTQGTDQKDAGWDADVRRLARHTGETVDRCSRGFRCQL